MIKRLCVYCGSNYGSRPEYNQAARELARAVGTGDVVNALMSLFAVEPALYHLYAIEVGVVRIAHSANHEGRRTACRPVREITTHGPH